MWYVSGFSHTQDGGVSGFLDISDHGISTSKKAAKLNNGQEYTSVVKVRKNGVEAYLDGKLISAWKTDYSDMSLGAGWSLKRNDVIGVGSFQSPTIFRTIEVIEVMGQGQS